MSEAAPDLNVLDGPTELAGFKMRPVTAGSLKLFRDKNLSMFLDGAEISDIEESTRQVATYIFIQSEPFEEVFREIRKPDFDEDTLLRFMFRLTPAALKEAVEVIQQNLSAAAANAVVIAPKQEMPGGKEESPPPNS